jgi:hypothetical protein
MSTAEQSEDPLVMVMLPYRSWRDNAKAMPGAHVHRAGCGHQAWISPQGEAFLLDNPLTETVCLDCKPKDISREYIVPGAVEAAEAAFGPDSQPVTLYRQYIHHNQIREWNP